MVQLGHLLPSALSLVALLIISTSELGASTRTPGLNTGRQLTQRLKELRDQRQAQRRGRAPRPFQRDASLLPRHLPAIPGVSDEENSRSAYISKAETWEGDDSPRGRVETGPSASGLTERSKNSARAASDVTLGTPSADRAQDGTKPLPAALTTGPSNVSASPANTTAAPGNVSAGHVKGDVAAAPLGVGFWSVSGTNFVDANWNVVKFSGVTWSGFETPNAVFGGLHVRSWADHIGQIQALGFNMIRLPFAGDILTGTVYPPPGKIAANPDLQGKSSLQILDMMISEFGKRGMKVILDYHRMHMTWRPEYGLWFDNASPEANWIGNWALMATRYKGNPTIIGADLFNEVHPGQGVPESAPLWVMDAGPMEPFNFRRATLGVIQAIHAIEPNWILFMEGMWQGPYWWGGNLAQVLSAPITEPANKLAYSAHDYGPFIADLPWFHDPTFPDNLYYLMSKNWGFIIENGIAPVWVGEFGSYYPPNTSDLNYRERTTFETQINYINKLGASWTIAFWGPDTVDTGSILEDDWATVNQEKMALLQPIMHSTFL